MICQDQRFDAQPQGPSSDNLTFESFSVYRSLAQALFTSFLTLFIGAMHEVSSQQDETRLIHVVVPSRWAGYRIVPGQASG